MPVKVETSGKPTSFGIRTQGAKENQKQTKPSYTDFRSALNHVDGPAIFNLINLIKGIQTAGEQN